MFLFPAFSFPFLESFLLTFLHTHAQEIWCWRPPGELIHSYLVNFGLTRISDWSAPGVHMLTSDSAVSIY